MSENPYQTHAWILLLASALPLVAIGVPQLVSDTPLAPGVGFGGITSLAEMKQLFAAMSPNETVMVIGMMRMWAASILVFFALYTAVLVKGYRKGQRWAWYAAWTNPVMIASYMTIATHYDGWGAAWEFGIIVAGGTVYALLVLGGLFLPYREFFPKRARVVSPNRSGSTFQKYAWTLLIVGALPLVPLGVNQLVSDTPLAAGLAFGGITSLAEVKQLFASSPEAGTMVMGFLRLFASSVLVFFILFATVVVNGCRKGRLWAWYAVWAYPALTLAYVTIATAYDGWGRSFLLYGITPGETVLLTFSLALFLYYRRVFQTQGRGLTQEGRSAAKTKQ